MKTRLRYDTICQVCIPPVLILSTQHIEFYFKILLGLQLSQEMGILTVEE
jgi:hypothetical protein